MFQVYEAFRWEGADPLLFRGVFLFGEDGIPLQGNRVINRFVNFNNDQILVWLMHHKNRDMIRLDGVVLPLYGDWAFNFWHWCNEALPVALTAHASGFQGTYLVPPNPFAAQSLRLLGIADHRIRVAGECDYHLECMYLFPKGTGHDPATIPARERIAAVFRAAFAQENPRHRLYISRNGHPDNMRKVVNEEELLTLLQRFDFTALRLEELSLSQQLAYTCNATALLGPHGAGMTHCAFMPSGSLVVELFSPTYINPCLILPCRALRHRYYQMPSHCLHDGYRYGTDIEANLQILEMTLERELSAI